MPPAACRGRRHADGPTGPQ